MKTAWLNTALIHPWKTILIGVLLVVAAGYGGQSLYFRGDYKVFFEPDNPQRVAFEDMQDIFIKNENASIIVVPDSGDVFNTQTLKLIQDITEEAWQTPLSTRVDSITNFQHTWSEEDDLIVEDLVMEPDTMDAEALARAKSIAINEPNLVDRMVSPSAHVAMINITVNLPETDQTQDIMEIVAFVTSLSEKYGELYPGHSFYHTGMVFMNYSFASEAQKDSQTLVPLMFVAIVVVLWALLRSFTGTFSTVVIIVSSIVATMGIAGWLSFFLSTATVNVPTLVMTLAVADCVHVIASMLYALRDGKTKQEAIAYSMKLNVMPIFITSTTTAIGFLTLNFANVPILQDLGNLTAIGVMLAFLFSVTLLPAMLMVLPIRVSAKSKAKSGNMERFGEWVISKHRSLLPISMLLVLVAGYFSWQNQVNDIATEYFDESIAFRASTDFQQANLSGMTTIDFALYSEEASGLNKPDMLQAVARFSEWLRQQQEVDHVATIADTFKRLNKNMHSDAEEHYRLPANQELAAQYLLLYEMSLPYGLDLNNQINIDKSATRITVTMQNLGSKELTEFEQRANNWIAQNAPQYRLTAGSPNLMFAHIGESNMESLMRGTVIALFLISALLVFALRSWRMGAISLLPNLLPALIGFGIWGMYSAQINMGLSVVLSMALGIIIDDTVHFLSKYRHARVSGKSPEDSIRYSFSSVGRALWITTLVLTIGFLVLSLSSFALNSDMGQLTAIIIVTALVVDFLFLPAFLMLFDKSDKKENDNELVNKTQVA